MAKVKKGKDGKPKSKRTGPSSSRALDDEKLRAVTGGVVNQDGTPSLAPNCFPQS
jgi:hypothetical protein